MTLFLRREKLLIPLETERYVRNWLLMFSVYALDSFLSLFGRRNELRISSCKCQHKNVKKFRNENVVF